MSYSEPSLAVELALDIAEHAQPRGVRVLWKSNGFMTARAVDLVSPVLDAVNIDVKAARERDHRRVTGASLMPVWDSIERLRSAGVWVEVSTPLVPGAATSAAQLRSIALRLAGIDRDIPWHVLRFTPDFRMQHERPTAPATLATAVEIGHEAGLRFVYVERALGDAGRATDCPGCGERAVERGIWETRSSRIVAGACPACGTSIAGRWDSAA
jgi:pyruvate formate lyase activating enzyme